MLNAEILYCRLLWISGVNSVVAAHHLAGGINKLGAHLNLVALGNAIDACAHIHRGMLCRHVWRGDVGSPHRHVNLVGDHEVDMPI